MRGLAFALLVGIPVGAASAAAPAPAKTAAEVIERNVAARGGLEAWRKVDTLGWFGHLEPGGAKDVQRVPFVMQLKRPNLTRFELKEQFNQFTRIFDGLRGWKVRPGADGRPETRAFSKAEADFARAEYVIDGPLIDYQAKGVSATLDGIDRLDGRQAYRLSLKLPGGAERKVWIDVATNLELRYDRPATHPLHVGKPVSVYYRDYATVDGLRLPNRIEVASGEAGASPGSADTLVIDRILVNPALEPGAFVPPATPMRRGGQIRIPATAPGAPPQNP